MGSAITGLTSFDPSALINSLIAPATSTTQPATIAGVSAQQEFSALEKNGDLEGLLSDNIAIGVMQIANPSPTTPAAATDVSNLVSQLISAYTTPAASTQQSAATPSTNPAMAIIKAMEQTGTFGSTMADSVGVSTLGQTTAS